MQPFRLNLFNNAIGTGKCTENAGMKGICRGESKREHNKGDKKSGHRMWSRESNSIWLPSAW